MKPIKSLIILSACLVGLLFSVAVWSQDETGQSLHELGFEQLMDLEVSTAARKDQPLSQTPAAAYVISSDDIRRSGAASIPEALRLAPGVSVAQISSSRWMISIRGFSGRWATKLLVLVDGRSVYSPVFSGVYWEFNDLLLEDVERVEVIRGPGAALWGANAVNGVINIITRSAADSQGALLTLGAASEQRHAAGRWGGELSEDTYLKLYAKSTDGDAFEALDGSGDTGDDYQRQQGGFRADWLPSGADQVTLQGDLVRMDQDYSLTLPDPLRPPDYSVKAQNEVDIETANLLLRWERSLNANSETRLQAYVDYYHLSGVAREDQVTTLDLDFQHRVNLAGRHDLVWGLGYRIIDSDVNTNPDLIALSRSQRSLQTFSGFVQDEIELAADRVWLTLGTKVEHNDLTGTEWQPNIRALWTPDSDRSLWASVSRAVRTPSIGELDYQISSRVLPPFSTQNPSPLPALFAVGGDSGYGSETLLAYEMGFRQRLHRSLTLDAAFYYSDYDDLKFIQTDPPEFRGGYVYLPAPYSNDLKASVYGIELAVDWHLGHNLRIQPALTWLQADFHIKSSSRLPENIAATAVTFFQGFDPELQLSLRAGWSPRHDVDLDLWLRYVSETVSGGGNLDPIAPSVDDYLTLDLRAAWRPHPGLELAVVGKNLLQARHLEAVESLYPVPVHVPRSLFASLEYSF